MTNYQQFLEHGGLRNELLILLHGLGNESNRLESVREIIRYEFPNSDILAPELPFAKNRFCLDKAEDVVATLLKTIDELVKDHEKSNGPYKSIVFVGHSFGAVLARKTVTVAFGEQCNCKGDIPAPFEPEFKNFRRARTWASMINRIVLIAGMNRGWSVSSSLDWITGAKWSIGQFLGETWYRSKPTIFAIRKGAPFLVQMRLQWLALFDQHYGLRPDILVVQLLGTIDDRVSPDDNVDYEIDSPRMGEPRSYFYIEVPHSGHVDIVEMSLQGPQTTERLRIERREKFLVAVAGNRDHVKQFAISREEMSDSLPPEPDETVTDLVFVVHGIRDKGFWTQKIARNIKRHCTLINTNHPKCPRKFASWTKSYGYFAMLSFLIPAVRQRKVEWLMDNYVQARAHYPKADFHYVGHSNGTYLAAQSLQDYDAVRFKRIVFAGSVVRCDYDWLALIYPSSQANDQSVANSRVEKVLNYVATGDWVVAFFPKAMQPWRWLNLGSAGHDGFNQASPSGPVHEIKYIPGAHSAGHEEVHWDDIAKFIVSGNLPNLTAPAIDNKQSKLSYRLGNSSFILFPLLLLIVILTPLIILWTAFFPIPCSFLDLVSSLTSASCGKPSGTESALKTIAFFLYIGLIYLFVTRF